MKVTGTDLLAEDILNNERVAGDAGDDLGGVVDLKIEVFYVLTEYGSQIRCSHPRRLSFSCPRPAVALFRQENLANEERERRIRFNSWKKGKN